MGPGGNFVVAYQTKVGGFSENIRLSRFNSAGSRLGDHSIAGSSAREMNPSVALDNFGNAVVAYQKLVADNSDIKARRVTGNGAVGGEIDIHSTTANETNPTVALRRDGGLSFVVAYDSNAFGTNRVQVAEVNASNVIVARHDDGGSRSFPALSIDGDGDYLLTY